MTTQRTHRYSDEFATAQVWSLIYCVVSRKWARQINFCIPNRIGLSGEEFHFAMNYCRRRIPCQRLLTALQSLVNEHIILNTSFERGKSRLRD